MQKPQASEKQRRFSMRAIPSCKGIQAAGQTPAACGVCEHIRFKQSQCDKRGDFLANALLDVIFCECHAGFRGVMIFDSAM